MITAQDIREKSFEKNRKGGYDMETVDIFLEDIADSINAYQKENSVLKSKMKVLVDKIEDYRANEEALNMAVLSAQKLAVQIEAEARARAASIVEEAETKAATVIGGISRQRDAEEKKLEEAKVATDKFLEGIRKMCTTQLKNLDSISAGIPKPAAPAVATAAPVAEEKTAEADEEKTVETLPVQKLSSKQKNFDSTQPFTL